MQGWEWKHLFNLPSLEVNTLDLIQNCFKKHSAAKLLYGSSNSSKQ